MKGPASRPVVITNAARSQEDQLRTRTLRYVAMMSIRMVCVVLAVVLVTVNPPLLWLWLLLCALGAVFLPWIAVVLANDRLPKERHRLRRPGARPARALPDRNLAGDDPAGADPAGADPAGADPAGDDPAGDADHLRRRRPDVGHRVE